MTNEFFYLVNGNIYITVLWKLMKIETDKPHFFLFDRLNFLMIRSYLIEYVMQCPNLQKDSRQTNMGKSSLVKQFFPRIIRKPELFQIPFFRFFQNMIQIPNDSIICEFYSFGNHRNYYLISILGSPANKIYIKIVMYLMYNFTV